MNVLILEDDESIRNTLATVLDYYGIRTMLARDNSEANNILTMDKVDIALLDYWLKGRETCAPIAERMTSMHIPFILITAGAEPAKLAAQLHSPMWMVKPFDVEALISVMRTAVRGGRNGLHVTP